MTVAIAAMVTFLSGAVAAVQDGVARQQISVVTVPSTVPTVPWQFRGLIKDVEPPPGDRAWVLQILTRGGFAAVGTANFEVMSSGELTCVVKSVACGRPLTRDDVDRLVRLLEALGPKSWIASEQSRCSDCVQTLILLHRREQGSVRTYVAHWDQSQAVPPEMRGLYETVVRLSGNP
jgi:hypothetical protein